MKPVFPTCQHRGTAGASMCWCHVTSTPAWVSIKTCMECPYAAGKDGVPPPEGVWQLGNNLADAFARVGVTEERVSAAIGAPCNCGKRKDALNAASKWVQGALGMAPKQPENTEE